MGQYKLPGIKLFSDDPPKSNPILDAIMYEPYSFNYENSIFKKQVDDIKSSFDLQLEALKKSNETLEAQLLLAKDSAAQAEQEAHIARSESRTSRRIAIISMIAAFISPFITLLIEHLLLQN